MYRSQEKPKHIFTSHADDRTTRTVITVMNGIVSRIAFPCYYMYRVDGSELPIPYHHKIPPIWKDHVGWPTPDQRDHSFQPGIIEEGLVVEPIHLPEEGYTLSMAAFDNPPDGFSWSTEIDDNIVRMTLNIACDAADSEEIEIPFALYVVGRFDVGDQPTCDARDLVAKGVVRILPALHIDSQEED